MQTRPSFFPCHLFALAAALLALAPGRAAADPPAIFVSNYGGGTGYVAGYSPTGGATTGYTIPTGFQNPQGLAYDPANNTLYASDLKARTIRTFNATTGAETQIGFANAALTNPVGLAYSAYSGGRIYVADSATISSYNAATGAPVTQRVLSGMGTANGLVVNSTTLYVSTDDSTDTNGMLAAFSLATNNPMPGFTTISGLSRPGGVALYGDDLFVANELSNTVGEYDALTGMVINANFITGLNNPSDVAVLGNRLLVANAGLSGNVASGTTVGAYGIPAMATLGNVPTSFDPNFITDSTGPLALLVVPEPKTWTLLAVGAGTLALAARRHRICAA